MNITLSSFEELKANPKYGNYQVETVITGISAIDMAERLDKKDLEELMDALIRQNGVSEILRHINTVDVIENINLDQRIELMDALIDRYGADDILDHIDTDEVRDYLSRFSSGQEEES